MLKLDKHPLYYDFLVLIKESYTLVLIGILILQIVHISDANISFTFKYFWCATRYTLGSKSTAFTMLTRAQVQSKIIRQRNARNA